jgi:hypothetical protein
VWEDIEFRRRDDGSIPPDVRDRLVSKTDEEANQAVAFVLEREIQAVIDGRDERKRKAAQATIADLGNLRTMLRVRAYALQVDRTWQAMPHEERVLLIGHVDRLGAPPTEDAAKEMLSQSIGRMAAATILGGAQQATGSKLTIKEAMIAAPITLHLLAIRQAGDFYAAPGQALKLLGIRTKRRWFGR